MATFRSRMLAICAQKYFHQISTVLPHYIRLQGPLILREVAVVTEQQHNNNSQTQGKNIMTTTDFSYLKQHGIQYLYHFTSKRNLKSINAMGGLWSKQQLDNRGVLYIAGGDACSRGLDARKGLLDFIHLSLCPEHPMKYAIQTAGRVEDPVTIKISIHELERQSLYVLYANDNAASNRAVIDGNAPFILPPDHLQLLANDEQRQRVAIVERKYKFQAEVLVRTHLSVNITAENIL
ncbi:MAG TPA: DarT ssDNA thymidine ADP-ribosyltransferase family protein [Chlorobiota bacterium]|nr:DarT ssDNA thymidine ADP-ribosyltransferase family protein [Chlorobiota bacterium]